VTELTPGHRELSGAFDALGVIAELVGEGRLEFDRSIDRRLALVFLWANVGSQLKQYCRLVAIPPGIEPFAGPIQMRDKLVYGPISGIDPELVWETCVVDGPELATYLSRLLSSW